MPALSELRDQLFERPPSRGVDLRRSIERLKALRLVRVENQLQARNPCRAFRAEHVGDDLSWTPRIATLGGVEPLVGESDQQRLQRGGSSLENLLRGGKLVVHNRHLVIGARFVVILGPSGSG